MSKILDLKTRIERLPQLQRQKLNNDKVASYTNKIHDAFCHLMATVNLRKCFLTVFPKATLKKTTDAVKQSKQQATRLIAKLKDDFNQIGTTETDQKVTRIGERNGETRDQLQKEWRKRLDEALKPLMPLVEIVKEVGFSGADKIDKLMDAVSSKNGLPPDSMEDAQRLKDDLTDLRQSLSALDLEGPGGEFLKNALNGRAKAKDFLNKEVQDFLDEKQLWDIFTINLG